MSQFQGTWIYNDSDALDETCIVEIPLSTTQSVASQYGLGSTDEPVRTVSLLCMALPAIRTVDREHGLVIQGAPQLLIHDPDDILTESCHLSWRDTWYRITTNFSSTERTDDTLKTVTLGALS